MAKTNDDRRSKSKLQSEIKAHTKTAEELRQRDARLKAVLDRKELERKNMTINIQTGKTVRI